ncbi:MAG: indolepyruvate oxidoreductase subunit beta [Promethearchaeota archaeon]|jgi:indolepyruvate ferredoxin oxidoreductase beta subunit
MEIRNFNFLIVGVGGQGVISAIQILTKAALLDNYKVRTAETHGMAQRGGSVSAFLRFGDRIEGPLIARGNCQVILALEASEAVRYFNYASSNTNFFINTKIIVPPTVHSMAMEYPNIEMIQKFLQQVSKNIYFVNGHGEALKVGNLRTLNIFMLGILLGSEKLPITQKAIEGSMMLLTPKKYHKINEIALNKGIEKGKIIISEIE